MKKYTPYIILGILLLIGIGVGVFIEQRDNGSSSTPIELKPEDSKRPSRNNSSKNDSPSKDNEKKNNINFGNISIEKQKDWSVKTYKNGANYQAILQFKNEPEPSGIILYGPSPADSLDGLVTIQIGNPDLYPVTGAQPVITSLQIDGLDGKLITIPLGGEMRAVGVVYIKPDKALIISMTGSTGSSKILKDRVKEWAAATSLDK